MPQPPRGPSQAQQQIEIGERVQWAREVWGHSQAAVARAIGTDPRSYGIMEKGGPKRFFTLFFIIKLALHLRVSTDYLLLGVLTGVEDREVALRLVAAHPSLLGPSGRIPLSSMDKGQP